MMQSVKVAITLFFIGMLFACNQVSPIETITPFSETKNHTSAIQTNTPTVVPTSMADHSPTSTVIPSTYTVTPTPILTPTLHPTSTPKVVLPPYQTKQVILKYSRFGGALGSPGVVFGDFFGNGRGTTVFVLYSDGQLILHEWGEPITTKILTEEEQSQLFSLLDKTGFYSVEASQPLESTNPIYNFDGKYDEVKNTFGVTSCLMANTRISKDVCIYEPYREFLIPGMKELFQFVYDYVPSNMEVYQPDRLLVFISKGHGIYDSFASEEDSIESIAWPSDLPSLETPEEKYLYLEGETALNVFSLFKTSSWLKIFNEGGQDYSVVIEVVFPHEQLVQP